MIVIFRYYFNEPCTENSKNELLIYENIAHCYIPSEHQGSQIKKAVSNASGTVNPGSLVLKSTNRNINIIPWLQFQA